MSYKCIFSFKCLATLCTLKIPLVCVEVERVFPQVELCVEGLAALVTDKLSMLLVPPFMPHHFLIVEILKLAECALEQFLWLFLFNHRRLRSIQIIVVYHWLGLRVMLLNFMVLQTLFRRKCFLAERTRVVIVSFHVQIIGLLPQEEVPASRARKLSAPQINKNICINHNSVGVKFSLIVIVLRGGVDYLHHVYDLTTLLAKS